MADFNSPYSCPSMYDTPVDLFDDLESQIWQFSDQSEIERMATLSDILPVPQNQVAVAGSNYHGAGLDMMGMPSPSDPIFTANYSDSQTLNPISFSNHDAYEDNAILPALDYVQTTGCEGLLESKKNISIATIVPPERTPDEEAKNSNSEKQQINDASLVVNDDSKRPPRHVWAAAAAAAKPPADGHNWRKYGQKHVKNSNFPRSYYRCTHLNCKVTKKIEYSSQGHVAEIIYKGSHCHPKANPSRDHHARKFLMRQKAVGKRCIVTAEMSSSARSACQPKYMIVIESHLVEVFDDGFRWRKYGQKVVKGNSNPRSYYKCTHPECSVKKHIERSPNDSKLLLTTYEGHHEHEIPATREHTSNNRHHNQVATNNMVLEAARVEYPMPLNMVPPGTISVEQPPASADADVSFGLAIVPYEGHHEREILAARDSMSDNYWSSLNSRGSSHRQNQAAADMALEARVEALIMAAPERFDVGFEYYPETFDMEQLASADVSFGAAIMPPLDSRILGMAIMPKVERIPELGASSSTAQLPLQANVPVGYRRTVKRVPTMVPSQSRRI